MVLGPATRTSAVTTDLFLDHVRTLHIHWEAADMKDASRLLVTALVLLMCAIAGTKADTAVDTEDPVNIVRPVASSACLPRFSIASRLRCIACLRAASFSSAVRV